MFCLVAQTTPNIKTETEFLQYAIPILITSIGILFYLLRDTFLQRIADKEAMSKQIVEIQLKNHELFTGIKMSMDTSNSATEALIKVLSNIREEDIKKKVMELQQHDQQDRIPSGNLSQKN